MDGYRTSKLWRKERKGRILSSVVHTLRLPFSRFLRFRGRLVFHMTDVRKQEPRS